MTAAKMGGTYVPSEASVEMVMRNLNDNTSAELALPGHWSPTIFYRDLKECPALNKRAVIEALKRTATERISYLDFFKETRGRTKEVSEFHRRMYLLFETGSVMLYFEEYFLRLLDKSEPDQYDNIVIKYIEILGKEKIDKWDAIVSQVGACCFQFFAKSPELYARLTFRTSINGPEDMTDLELLSGIGHGQLSLSPTRYVDKVSIHDSRDDLIRLFQGLPN